jgi:crotonobetainyl-CoA:carnitine CoA-transferase CaiB-like acyl-CoA transferase
VVSSQRSGPCSSVKVVEISSMVTAPLCGQILGDLGADVIKVEPLSGDVMRTIPPVYKGVSAAFAQWNRNKRSIAVNLKSAEGVDIVHKLVSRSDVFVENMRTGIADALGLSYGDLTKQNADLIYVSITGYGPDGPYSNQPGYDMMVQGLTGFMPVQGYHGKPEAIRSIIGDKVTAYAAAMAIMAALVYRKSGGCGQKIDINIMDAYAAFMLPDAIYTKSFLEAPESVPFTPDIYNTIQVKDGMVIGYVMTEEQFKAACEVFNRPDLLTDARFSSGASRNVNQKALMAEIEKSCAHYSLAELLALTRSREIPFAPVNDIDAFTKDPQAVHNETFVEFDTKEVGRVRLMNGFSRFAKTPINARALAPALGNGTDDILASLDYSNEHIAELRQRKIVA